MISELLNAGKANATDSDVLEILTGLSKRELFKQISNERKAGALILGCSKGFFLPASNAECMEYIRRAEKEIAARMSALKQIRRLAKIPEGQEALRL